LTNPGGPSGYKSEERQVEEELQQFMYEINREDVGTDWTPQKIKDHQTASMFALVVSKLAEDMSYEETGGDEFWDAKKIMKRQIDNRPLHHCKKDYEKRRLALLVDTSPSCREEAIFYSRIASGAMLRDDIDIFLAPNGRIDGIFSPKHRRFVRSDRKKSWGLEGRVILYFTDWDGCEQIATHSKESTIYWFDNLSNEEMWYTSSKQAKRIRHTFRGTRHYCPDPDTFKKLARKIRP